MRKLSYDCPTVAVVVVVLVMVVVVTIMLSVMMMMVVVALVVGPQLTYLDEAGELGVTEGDMLPGTVAGQCL